MSPYREPFVVVCAGGGGVGKTTTAAALALAAARRGRSTLIVTIDPARRLAGALGVPITDEVTRVALPAAEGRLFALMPDPRRSLRTFAEQLFKGEQEAMQRVLRNGIYRGFEDAAAGVHELVAMNLVAHASSTGAFDLVVIDTAPSRFAVDFVTYPGRLAALLGGRTVTWLSSLARQADKPDAPARRGSTRPPPDKAGYIERLVARVTGPRLIRETAALFGDLALVRARFVALTQRASELLMGTRAAYVLVAAPTAAAHDDVLFLAKRLEKLGHLPRAVVINRADTRPAPFVDTLRGASDVPASILSALDALRGERLTRAEAAGRLALDFAKKLKGVPQVRLSFIEATAPEAIVMALSEELDAHLATVLPKA
jgi:anion-transporting  ArsA/GET3 family ATPase